MIDSWRFLNIFSEKKLVRDIEISLWSFLFIHSTNKNMLIRHHTNPGDIMNMIENVSLKSRYLPSPGKDIKSEINGKAICDMFR